MHTKHFLQSYRKHFDAIAKQHNFSHSDLHEHNVRSLVHLKAMKKLSKQEAFYISTCKDPDDIYLAISYCSPTGGVQMCEPKTSKECSFRVGTFSAIKIFLMTTAGPYIIAKVQHTSLHPSGEDTGRVDAVRGIGILADGVSGHWTSAGNDSSKAAEIMTNLAMLNSLDTSRQLTLIDATAAHYSAHRLIMEGATTFLAWRFISNV